MYVLINGYDETFLFEMQIFFSLWNPGHQSVELLVGFGGICTTLYQSTFCCVHYLDLW